MYAPTAADRAHGSAGLRRRQAVAGALALAVATADGSRTQAAA
jgi:hypothetical protein